MSLELVAWALVLLAIADWGATVALIRGAQAEPAPALTERAIVSVILSTAATGFAVLSIAFLARVRLPPDVGTFILVGGLMLISLPQLIWYAAYRAGQFR